MMVASRRRDLRALAFRIALMASVLTAAPALAQIDISGEWGSRLHEDLHHRFDGADLGDYTGLPLNEAGLRKAESWDAAILSNPEEQAKPHSAHYSMRGPGTNLRILKLFDDRERLTGYRITGLYGRADRTIWMDGRPHPSEHAEFTWDGFSTGVIDKNKLVVTTTHMKAGFINRNGAPASLKAKMTEFFVRHGNLLTLTSIVEDPVYLDEPFIRTSTWVLTPNLGVDARFRFEPVDEIADRPKDAVPAYPLGTHHDEFAKAVGLPFEATLGGARSLYPEYVSVIEALQKGQKSAAPPPTPAPPPPEAAPVAAEVEVLTVRPNIHMLVVDGHNVTVQTGKDGVLIVDPGPAASAEKMLAAVRKLSDGPIRYAINTTYGPDSTGADAAVVRAGGERTDAPSSGPLPGTPQWGVDVVSHENVLLHLNAMTPPPPDEGVPNSTISGARKDIYFNGEPIELHTQPKARTDGDIMVLFRGSDVVVAGGLLDTTRYPFIDVAAGGTLDGQIAALTELLEMTVPERNQMGGTLVVPGRGRICNESDIDEYRNMLIIVRDRIKDMVSKRQTLAQVKAARPLLEYDGVYGSRTGPWTSDMFLETVYREYSAAKGKTR